MGDIRSNRLLFQFFHWYAPDGGRLWRELAEQVGTLADRGVTDVWLPPPFKGAYGGTDVGYTVYDAWDLGEFDQKGTVPTKYGTRDELLHAIRAARAAGLEVVADVVHNHRCGGDETEEVRASVVADDDRLREMSEPMTIRPWTRFTFPGRGGAYSDFQWRAEHFVAVDAHEADPGSHRVYVLEGKRFSDDVSRENANYDFLLGCDVDLEHPDVVAELDDHGRWLVEAIGVTGFRIDAAKHVSLAFTRDWLGRRSADLGRQVFAVAEYPSGDPTELVTYAAGFEGAMHVFDTPLHDRLHQASVAEDFDLRTILEGALVSHHPDVAVTFVDSHDTQEGCTLESWVADWFRPHAYALILLRPAGVPCVFYPDYFGASRAWLDPLLFARRDHGHGPTVDRFDDPGCIGWLRGGDDAHPGLLAVVMSTRGPGSIRFETGAGGAIFRDWTGRHDDARQADEHGHVDLPCAERSVSVWVQETAPQS